MAEVIQNDKHDFSQGTVWRNIVRLALPMTVAQLVQALYNVVDRIYLGHLPGASALALTGVGLAFPLTTLISAFTNLLGQGGAPLCAIARGEKNTREAEGIMGNTLVLLVAVSALVMTFCMIFKRPILYLFGASDATYPYAADYLSVYLWGTPFAMVSLGMNGFINAQGFGRDGMLTIVLGAVLNVILDPIFLFVFSMGVRGAALATVISQFISMLWVMRFLLGKRAVLQLSRDSMKLAPRRVGRIFVLGISPFLMSATNSVTQVACNSMLQAFGGDVFVGVMTVLNSVREIFGLPMQGINAGAQPVLGYNYGAREYRRVRSGILFTALSSVVYAAAVWALVMVFPSPFVRLFTSDADLIREGTRAIRIYYLGYFMMALQSSGQGIFLSLGRSKQAIFFSLLRKIIIILPLTLILPYCWSLGVDGVFYAEPISNFIGGTACFVTMLLVVWRGMVRAEKAGSQKDETL